MCYFGSFSLSTFIRSAGVPATSPNGFTHCARDSSYLIDYTVNGDAVDPNIFDNRMIVSQSPLHFTFVCASGHRIRCKRILKKNRTDFFWRLRHWSLKTINFIVHLGNRARIRFILTQRVSVFMCECGLCIHASLSE